MKHGQIKKFMCLVLTAVIVLTAGCGNHSSGKNNKGAGTQEADSAADTVMGRYVEEEMDLSENLETVSGMKKLPDGRLIITDRMKGLLISNDNGTSWESESRQWLEEKLHTAYIMDLQMMPDGTLGIIYDDYEDDEPESAFNLSPECALVRTDGTVIPVSLSLTEEEMYVSNIWMSDAGRMFVTTLGDNIYEIKEDGSSELFLTIEDRPMLLKFLGELMLIDGYNFKAPLLYNMEKGEYVKDEALEEFVNDSFGDRQFNGGSWYDLYFFFDEEGICYLAGEKGLYRHVIGEDTVEQLIDGSLSRLGNPQYGLKDMISFENGEFLAVFSSGKLVRFTYDPDMPAVPDKKLKVYSLEESYSIRVATSIYQVMHPDVFVEYEIGMEGGDGITREDAIKKLNTRIMAGEGPDLFMLDGLPMDSYIEKGLLLDLGSFVDDLSGKEELFENLFQAFERKDGIYAVPGEVLLPVMLGREKYVSGIKDLASAADAIEQIREDNTGKDILGYCSEKRIMKIFAVACAPAWKEESGEIDREAVSEFLTQMKRIYEAQMEGISEKSLERLESNDSYFSQEYGEDWVYDILPYGLNTLDYVGGYSQFMVGTTTYPYGYYDITSAAKAPGFEDTMLIPMVGQSNKIFVPQTIMGINAASSQRELAEDFLGTFLGQEVQCALGGFAVNRTALDELFMPDEKYLGEDGSYGAMAMMDEDGVEVNLDVYYPEKDEIDTFMSWMETVDTPYIADTVFEKTVFEEGAEYIQGNQSLEEALDDICAQLAINIWE